MTKPGDFTLGPDTVAAPANGAETRDVLLHQIVYENTTYRVQVVRLSDRVIDSYGVINKSTGVVESVQNILSQAIQAADSFAKWLAEPKDKPNNPFEVVTGNAFN